MDATTVAGLVEAEISRIARAELVDTIRKHLVPPRVEQREWDYGEPGQSYPCWIVLEDQISCTAVAYCEHGFGPKDPWGLLSTTEPNLNMGMDSAWFATLEDSVRDSMFWQGKNPPGYEVQ